MKNAFSKRNPFDCDDRKKDYYPNNPKNQIFKNWVLFCKNKGILKNKDEESEVNMQTRNYTRIPQSLKSKDKIG